MKFSPNRYPLIQTIELSRTSWTRWAGSVAIHTVLLAVLIVVSGMTRVPDVSRPQRVSLLEPAPLVEPRPFLPAKPVRKPPEVHRAKLNIAPKPRRFVAPRIPAGPALVKVTQIESPKIEPQQVARLDLPDVHLPKPDPIQIVPPPAPAYVPPPVKVGGFGNPDAARPSPASSAGRTPAPQLGQFDLSPGSNSGHGVAAKAVASAGFGDSTVGAAQQGQSHGTVRSGGFRDAATAAPGVAGKQNRGLVQSAGFNATQAAQPAVHAARAAAPADKPVEITFKPKPAYTAEARAKRIQGEVLLEVLFAATGEIRVLRVTRGLGFGLDETAREAASHIRFRPGTRGGEPVDMKGTVHILFELS